MNYFFLVINRGGIYVLSSESDKRYNYENAIKNWLLSLLVFFVLAMQCLPTQAVTRRETGSWKWAVFQLVYMTAMAYVAALVTYQVVHAANIG